MAALDRDDEFRRLVDLMPASGRMYVKLALRTNQARAIEVPFPVPWNREARRIYINFDLWQQLDRPQRDLLFLRGVAWLTRIRWFKLEFYQSVAAAGAAAVVVELAQADAVGAIAAGGLSAIAAAQIWRRNRSAKAELDADEAAVKVAQRRGYDPAEAATHLRAGIEAMAALEGRPAPNFVELLRCQNLKARANRSPVGVPDAIRDRE